MNREERRVKRLAQTINRDIGSFSMTLMAEQWSAISVAIDEFEASIAHREDCVQKRTFTGAFSAFRTQLEGIFSEFDSGERAR